MPARFFDRAVLRRSARMAAATVASLLMARGLLRLPEFYWAPISTIVILLSTIDPVVSAIVMQDVECVIDDGQPTGTPVLQLLKAGASVLIERDNFAVERQVSMLQIS